jgi:hypothetical protein
LAPKKRNKIDGQFNARLIEMMESPAYRVLSLSAHRVLDRISIELAHHGGNDNGKLPVTYDQFEEYGVHRQAIAPAIRELEALGFVEVTQRGRSSAGEHRWPNLFRLTCVNCKSTPNPTHEWRRVPDVETATALVRISRRSKKQNPSTDSTTGSSADSVLKTTNLQYGFHPYCPSTDSTTTSIFRGGAGTSERPEQPGDQVAPAKRATP